MLISWDCYYWEQHSISVVSIRENSVSLYASSPYLTMGPEWQKGHDCRQQPLKRIHCSPGPRRSPGVCAPLCSCKLRKSSWEQIVVCLCRRTQWRSNYSLLTSCELRFSEASNEARLGQVGVFPPLGIQAASTYYIFAKSQFSGHK